MPNHTRNGVKPQSNEKSNDKREDVRFEQHLSARLKNQDCSVLNISNKGVLLETNLPPYHFTIEHDIVFELELDGEWMPMAGVIQWTASFPTYSRVGVSIENAPASYLDLLHKLYG